jgi:putative oxidoreductase
MSFDLSRFDPRDGDNIIRISAGAFMFPHVAGKFLDHTAVLGFFTKAGFPAPEFFVALAAVTEAVSGICLVLGLWVRLAAPAAAGALFAAAAALYEVGGFKWVWNKGGFEYPMFWGLVCLALTVKAWTPEIRRLLGPA